MTPRRAAKRALRAPVGASPEDRAELGKAARAEWPRSAHAEWEPPPGRPDPVAMLDEQAGSRIPELVPLRYGRMLASPFTFYRGAAEIMAADLASTPASGLWAQLCGDAHLSNFGGFAAPDRRLVFDLNDFDETLPGPWEWDLKRLAVSFEVGARDRDLGPKSRRLVVRAVVRSYRERMRALAKVGNLDVWSRQYDLPRMVEEFGGKLNDSERRVFERNMTKTRSKDRMRALSKLTVRRDGELRIASNPPVLVPLEDLTTPDQMDDVDARLRAMLGTYRRTLSSERRHLFDGYRYVHAARKVVGVGSVGTRAWVALFVGRDEGDPLFLQIKEAEESVLERYVAPSKLNHHGRRVVEGQRLMQATGDVLLGWMTAEGFDGVERTFYVRQLWDAKGSARFDLMSANHMLVYAELCGAILARAHARSGDRIAIGAYLGGGETFDRAVTRFAESYADQNERDYEAMRQAVLDGRIEVELEAT